MCGKPGKGTQYKSLCQSHVSKIKSFLPVAAETSLMKVWTDGQMDGQGDCNIASTLCSNWLLHLTFYKSSCTFTPLNKSVICDINRTWYNEKILVNNFTNLTN